MNLTVAILAGGLATRLRPLTDAIPKSLIDVNGRPFAEHQLKLLKANGFERVVFCVGHLGEQIEAVLGDGSRFGLSITYVADGVNLMGTGGAIRRALPYLGDSFLVMYGDSYLQCDFQAVASAFVTSGKLGLMTIYRNGNRWERSNVRFNGKEIEAYDKRNADQTFAHVDYGLGALQSRALQRYKVEQPLDLAEVYADLVRERQLAAFEVRERFYEIGSFAGLTELRAILSGT